MSEGIESDRDDGPSATSQGNRPANEYPQATSVRHSRPSLFWPIALIGFGVLLLLSNMGLIPATGWALLWRLWPIALIALGLDVLIGRRSVAGAIASGVIVLVLVGTAIGLVLFAEQIPVLVDLARAPALKYESVDYPRAGIESADVTVDFTGLPGSVGALNDSANLMEADIAYRGDLIFTTEETGSRAKIVLDSHYSGIIVGPSGGAFDERGRWNVALSAGIPLALDLDAGSGRCSFDLTELDITDLAIDAGSGGISLALPGASSFSGEIDGGSGAITITVPDGVGLRLELDDGSGGFQPGHRLQLVSGEVDDDSVWETGGYSNADYQVELLIDQGSGKLTIQ